MFEGCFTKLSMIVISDTTPLITLLKINRLDLLERLYGTIIIPFSVYRELTDNPYFKDEADIVKNCNFIQVKSISNINKVESFQKLSGLDKGESEAIILYQELNSNLLLMDEAHGRYIAKQLQCNITGSIGILATAYKIGIITSEELKSYALKLSDSGRYISKKLIFDLLSIIEE